MKINLSNTIKMKNSILILAISLLIVACGGGSKDPKADLEKLKKQRTELDTKIAALEELLAKSDTTTQAIDGTEVTVMPLKAQTFKTYIEVQGRVDADENVSLSSEIPGTITKIDVKVGDRVTKGQVLAETDARPMMQQLADLQGSLDLAKQVYEKQKSLWDQKIGTEIQYLQSKNTKEGLELKIAALQEQVRMSKITSPIDGTVDALNIKLGQATAPGFNAITVVNFNNLKIKADVADSYASRIKNGDEALVLFPDTKDSLSSTVHYAARAINALTRTFGVEVLLDNKKEYHPNMVAKLKINDYRSPNPSIVLPVKYIQKGADESYVLVEANGKAEKRIITIGREYSGTAEVLSGLKEGDLLITEGYDLVIDGDYVTSKK